MSIKSIDCCGFFTVCLTKLGVVDEKIDIYEAQKRLKMEAENWSVGDSEEFWPFFTQSPSPPNEQLPRILNTFEKEEVKPGLAVDLGCGNSTSTLCLLERGWKVIAVDCTNAALEHLKKRVNHVNKGWLTHKRLILVHCRMEDFKFPKNVQMIIANDSLNYCDPSKLIHVWRKCHSSLAKGGRVVGNFFVTPSNPMAEQLGRQLMGGWYSDKGVVDALLDDSGYKKELCAYNKKWYEPGPMCIEFRGKKV
jgi:SAM-dependent methyltransferase